MAIDFFDNCTTEIGAIKFGLCDDPPPPHKQSYCKIEEPNSWIATVENPDSLIITFTAIDCCTKIYRSDNPKKEESLCDCMLTYLDRITFVELKDRDYPGVIREAKEQLANTIYLFNLSHNLFKYRMRKAYIANKKKPNFPYQRQAEMDEFKRKHNVILIPDAIIKIR